MARWLVLVVLACGCRQIWGLGGTPELAIDAAPDVPADIAIDGPPCFGSFGDAPYCFDAAPTGAFTVATPTTLDTQTSTDCSPLFHNECVVAASLVEIDDRLSAIGTRPLVLIATTVVHVSTTGVLDAASHHNGNRGAASGSGACDIGNNPTNSGGGQGGTFGGLGGDGGKGEAGHGGSAGPTIVPLALRAGCDGQDGGAAGGSNGTGGGAIYVIAVAAITIDGAIDASGSAGGAGSGNVRGGGGGGSGGMIVLEAPLIDVPQGIVFANGGGGGGGASATGNGTNGDDPTDVTSALGGLGGALSGQGGNGSGIATPDGQPGFDASGAGGGGGGGGGAGVIKTIGGTIANMLAVSPAPS